MKNEIITVERNTKETNISLSLTLRGKGKADVHTGIGFLDHMLEAFSKHGLFDLSLRCEGDLLVDSHHTIEDVGIVLGSAIKKAVGDKIAMKRYGHVILPMDDALILCAIDLSGRPYLAFDVQFSTPTLGKLDTEMIREFFYAVSYGAEMNLHMKQFAGFNAHHIAEACFKAFAKALDMATLTDSRIEGVWSTKGSLS
ncbi:MAG: imidazoleglycerol-phosphate dehydratase HisB [Lachnospiraceae bacterium]|jgi:imidazoleglycerol-phosphate dehydratase|nr:imidazoleglycerol-phosphate dehydratase HisB [Lachnospiraceae bacterium]